MVVDRYITIGSGCVGCYILISGYVTAYGVTYSCGYSVGREVYGSVGITYLCSVTQSGCVIGYSRSEVTLQRTYSCRHTRQSRATCHIGIQGPCVRGGFLQKSARTRQSLDSLEVISTCDIGQSPSGREIANLRLGDADILERSGYLTIRLGQ